MKRPGHTMSLAALALALAACGGTAERPDQDLARAEAGIRQAEQGGAGQYGALELQAARDKLERARAAANDGDMEAAERFAEQAALDADFAAARTRSRKAELAVKEVENSIAVLREEMQRRDRNSGGREGEGR